MCHHQGPSLHALQLCICYYTYTLDYRKWTAILVRQDPIRLLIDLSQQGIVVQCQSQDHCLGDLAVLQGLGPGQGAWVTRLEICKAPYRQKNERERERDPQIGKFPSQDPFRGTSLPTDQKSPIPSVPVVRLQHRRCGHRFGQDLRHEATVTAIDPAGDARDATSILERMQTI